MQPRGRSAITLATLPLSRLWFGALVRFFCTHQSLVLENLALRQQLAVLTRRHPRSRLGPLDKLFLGCGSPLLVRLEQVSHPRELRNLSLARFQSAHGRVNAEKEFSGPKKCRSAIRGRGWGLSLP